MFELFKNPNLNFIGRRRWAYIISILFILAGVGSMVARGGLRYGIDFSGGTLIQVRFEKAVPVNRIRAALETVHMGESVIQEFGDTREYLLRLPLTDVSSEEVTRRIQEAMAKDAALGPPEIRRVEFVGPQVGRDLQIQAIYAALWSTAGILAYVAFRFDLLGGLASVAAIVHDVLICLAALSLTNREMSLPVLAALLTIIGYSVNDTIVAYDRVRENRLKGRRKGETFETQINNAINQTLSRTVLTALTVFFTTAVL
jgi:preprotein translocase SecF subunit